MLSKNSILYSNLTEFKSSQPQNDPIIIYPNGDTDKLQILTDNKGKVGYICGLI